MATQETLTLLLDVQVEATKAVQNQQALKQALSGAKAELDSLKKSEGELSEAYIAQEAQVKQLNTQLAANSRVLTAMSQDTGKTAGAYAVLNKEAADAARLAKDMAAAYGVNSKQAIDASASAKTLSDNLKKIDAAVGQNQRAIGDYGIVVQKMPGMFGEMQAKGESMLVSLRTKFESGKDMVMNYRDAMAQSREAVAASMAAAEKAAIAEQALATAEKAGAATATLAAEAEAARAVATDAATVATNLGSKAMQIFKVALISTGIGALVVALGAVVAYFTQTNEGSKQFAKISAGISAVLQSGIKILGSYGKLLFAIATFDLKKIKEGWAEIGENIRNATGDIKENYKAGVQNTANQQMMAKREREWSGQKLALLKEYEAARFNAGKKSKLDDEGKIAAAKKAMQINELIFQNDLKIAKNKAIMIENEQKLVSKKDYQAIQDAKNKVQEIINAHSMQQITVDALLGKAEGRLEGANNAEVKSEKEKIAEKKKLNEEADKAAAEAEVKRLKDNADIALAALDNELQMVKLKQEERLAGQKLTDEQIHAQKLADSEAAYQAEQAALKIQLDNKQITQAEYDAAEKLNYQQKLTDKAVIDAEAEALRQENKAIAAATDLENEMALAEMKGQSLYDLKLQQLKAERLLELAEAEKTGADKMLIEQKYTAAKKKLAQEETAAKMDMASNFAGNIAEIFGKNTKVGKMASSAQIAIDTAKGAMGAISSFSSLGPIGIPLGIAAAGAVIAKGARSIKDVWAVKSGLPGDGGGGGASVPTSATSGGAAASVTGSVVARQSGSTQQQAATSAMTEAMKAAPTQTVLVTNDLTTALDNKVQLKNDNSL
jgi:hypothetical protein